MVGGITRVPALRPGAAACACRRIRELAGVAPADYIAQLASDQSLRLLASPGKSGSVFFLSGNEGLLVKTIRKVGGIRMETRTGLENAARPSPGQLASREGGRELLFPWTSSIAQRCRQPRRAPVDAG